MKANKKLWVLAFLALFLVSLVSAKTSNFILGILYLLSGLVMVLVFFVLPLIIIFIIAKRLKNRKIKKLEDKVLLFSLLSILIFIFFMIYISGFFSSSIPKHGTASGFEKIKVFDTGIYYRANKTIDALSFTIISGVGQNISNLRITSITGSCSAVGTDTLATELSTSETDSVSLNCINLSEGDPFSVNITFSYNMLLEGTKIHYDETGILTWVVEP